ncbi:MAG TPA: right-handed parallel beta-helix repeat-containing protein [Candidatus Eisenbacteria bacterium]|nr:right-handed parallel beta-helix repeat-containing protein [Candidatus Eisenbacteria bacterium]
MTRLRHPRGALRCAIVLALAIATCGTALAGTYYVDMNSSACSNTGPGTQGLPYCSISAAIAAHHTPGTIIRVMPGVYREQVTVPASGTAVAPIVIEAVGSDVVIDGSDDFTSASLWTQYAGNVWLAASVTWAPIQVFTGNTRLQASTGTPDTLPAGSFVYVPGSGLYVNVGGGNPGPHGLLVGHRTNGVYLYTRAYVRVEGFTVLRADDRGIELTGGAHHVQIVGNRVHYSGHFGIQLNGVSAIQVTSNVVSHSAGHGISLIAGTTGSTIEANESSDNSDPVARRANGIYLFDAPQNRILRNRVHDNQDSGLHIQSGSDYTQAIQNMSWHNGDHGFDHLFTIGNVHIGEVAYGNHNSGYSIEANSTGQEIYNCISVDNGLTTDSFDLYVEAASQSNFLSEDNIFWNSTAQEPVRWGGTKYASVAEFSALTTRDTRTIQADPRFADPANGNFHLTPGSPAIDNANSSVPNWPALDAERLARADDPSTSNAGRGPVMFADRGAMEFGGTPGGPEPPPPGGGAPAAWMAPNPLESTGVLSFATARPGPLTVRIYDINGREVRTLMNGIAEAGDHAVPFDGTGNNGLTLTGGVYFFRIRSDEGDRSGRFMIVR